jgi:anthraniloyl-CoA monooxygenase
VVFSDQTLENFRLADQETWQEIVGNFVHWDAIDVHVRGKVIRSHGHGFSGIGRHKLLNILQQRATQLGVDLRFRNEVQEEEIVPRVLGPADLIVAADGVNSVIRRKFARFFSPEMTIGKSKYVWLGTKRKFEAFTFYFVENDAGVFQAHCYSFDPSTSAFIVECDDASWRSAGFDRMDATETVSACEALFRPWLEDDELLFNFKHKKQSPWLSFIRLRNARWFHENIVLLGDAAHTAHFSVGSGTKLAMEDALCLARAIRSQPDLPTALNAYEQERMIEALRLQNAARNSMEWFENVKRYRHLDPQQFTYSLLTRSQRVGHENLRMRDASYVRNYEQWFACHAASRKRTNGAPPMFTSYTLRSLRLENRIAVSPMDMYSAQDGTPTDFHLVHLGSRALGGAGLLFTEMTCVSPEGRITYGCTGMYEREHVVAWQRIAGFVHSASRAKICLQLGHSGRKGSLKLPWEGDDVPLENGWQLIGPSAIEYAPGFNRPREMDEGDMARVCAQFVAATNMAVEAGFDMLELHCAHGYLLSSFLTPLSNHRADKYGGPLENRLRFPLRVFSGMRAVWPQALPMSVRISATDWVEDGITGDDSVVIARAFYEAGADIIHVSTGQTSTVAKPVYGRMYQTPFSDRIRNETGVPTIAVGNIVEADQVNGIIAAGRADLCALARPHLSDPHWTLHAAATLGYDEQHWPLQYATGKAQLERELRRAASAR